MKHSDDPISKAFINLALAIEQHIPGYVDAYYGPPGWQQQAEKAGPRSVAELVAEATDLTERLTDMAKADPHRHNYLTKELRSISTTLQVLGGEELSFLKQVNRLYDITPEWVDERVFEEAHQILEALLPPGQTVYDRMSIRRKSTEISVEQAEPLLQEIMSELRLRTQSRYQLPAGESIEMQLVKNEPWKAYNWYLGDFRSRIDVNTDTPLHITGLVFLMAHEGYPGHHTEHAIKEQKLVRERGYQEFSTTILYSPSGVLAEGIANRAAPMLLSDEDWITWHQDELFPRSGFDHLNAEAEHAINSASIELEAVLGNVAIMLHDQGANEEEAMAYLQRYGLVNEEVAQHMMGFLNNRLSASYAFNYYIGGRMLDSLFEAQGNRDHWFTRLLSEPVTPSQVRAWSMGD